MIDEYPFTGFLTPTGLAAETNGLVGGVVPGEQGEGFPLFIEPTSASSAMGKFGLERFNGYLAIGPYNPAQIEGLAAVKSKQILDVPSLGISGVVEAIKLFPGFGDFGTVEVAVSRREYGGG